MELQQTVNDLWKGAISDRTRASYSQGYKTYVRFLALNNVTWLSLPPISEDILIYFVAHCHSTQQLSHATIKLYLCGVRYQYFACGGPSPFSDATGTHVLRLQMILRSVKKASARPGKPRYPITISVLNLICAALDKGVFSPYTDFMLKTVCTTAYFEFTCLGKFSPGTHLCVGDIYFTADRALLALKVS